MNKNTLSTLCVLLVFSWFFTGLQGQEIKNIIDLSKVPEGKGWKIVNRTVTPLEEGSIKGLHFDEKPGQGIAWLENSQFTTGEIEFDIRGKDVLQQSFIGVAFWGLNDETYDAVYFRPFNFKNPDTTRRVNAVQYVSHPDFTWQKLRAEKPGQYEKPVNPVPDPNGWFHVRVSIAKPVIKVFVNDATEPCLTVDCLGNRESGMIGLWVGNGSGGDFANLVITPSK